MNSKIRLYLPNNLIAGKNIKLSKNQSHYIKNVLRLNIGENVSVFNSLDGEWNATILNHGKEISELNLKKNHKTKRKRDLWLAFSMI